VLIWRKLLVDGEKIVTSEKIRQASRNLGKDYTRSLRYLQEHNYLMRIFRGIFYVNSSKERDAGAPDRPIFRIVAEALALKSVKHWYMGLETALRINGLTHEYFNVNYIITDSYRTTKVIRIADARFHFLKWSRKHFESGIRREFDLKFSDREKTILDLVYKRYLDNRDERYAISPLMEYEKLLDRDKVRLYLAGYPLRIQEIVGAEL
jgi:hypothetical protein